MGEQSSPARQVGYHEDAPFGEAAKLEARIDALRICLREAEETIARLRAILQRHGIPETEGA